MDLAETKRASDLGKHAYSREEAALINRDDAPRCPGLRSFFSNSFVMLFEASAFGASALASTLPLFLGNRVCDTSQFAYGSPLFIAALVVMPVSLLGFVGGVCLRPSDKQLNSDEENELSPKNRSAPGFEQKAQVLEPDLLFTTENNEPFTFSWFDIINNYMGRPPVRTPLQIPS